ncbi:hypothetical protein [Maribellus maritimus]|uniref:hypothetical protein n=1 Tax=Maribellus maritimus TaxID=2870838 RepID=UPI001EEA2EBA|nr:hypothetical protein [Maribellus maritimus]MCG6190170.1 hypothetical protein [Maribellus maritimus]
MHKLQNMISRERKLWKIGKGVLYFFSLSFMVFWGYVKADIESPKEKNIVVPEKQEISSEQQKSDTLFYAFSKIIDDFSKKNYN